jgi:hypothetical protein
MSRLYDVREKSTRLYQGRMRLPTRIINLPESKYVDR